jgi:hypothetical protein
VPPETKRSRNEVETSEKGSNQKILVFGEASDKFFTVSSKYLQESKYKVYDTGFKDFAETCMEGRWFKKDFLIQMFWEQWEGKMFNDLYHVGNVMMNINNPKKNG